MQFESDPNLRAWNVGYLAGQPKSEHQDDISYFQRHPDEQIPNGESLNQFRQRVHPSILKALQSGISTGKPSIVFAHSSICKEVGNMLHGDHNAGNVKPGGILQVVKDENGFKVHPVLKGKEGKQGYGQ
jgi:broad specificity phosphatase PhoE